MHCAVWIWRESRSVAGISKLAGTSKSGIDSTQSACLLTWHDKLAGEWQKFWREIIWFLPINHAHDHDASDPTHDAQCTNTIQPKPTIAKTMVPVSPAVPLLGSPLLLLLLAHVASCFYIPRSSVSIIRGVAPTTTTTNNNNIHRHGLAIVASPPPSSSSIRASRAPNHRIKLSPSSSAAAAAVAVAAVVDVTNYSNTSLKSSMTDNVAEETGTTIIAGPWVIIYYFTLLCFCPII